MTVRIALVGGPMYDDLYRVLDHHDVEVVVHADHPTLNREVTARLDAGERLDVISTHGKYAPSQARWLHPLDDLVAGQVIAGLAPRAVELCRHRGALLCVPRNIDVRVLWWRTDRLDAAPVTWDDVIASPGSFGFTGRESGLFGLFYELLAAAGARPFDDDGHPTLDGPEAVEAVHRICALAAKAPAELATWHYDDVDDALLDGRVDMAAAWPGGSERIRASELADVLRPAPYPGGRSYAGCHAWAIPRTCGDLEGAVALVETLAGTPAGVVDAGAGTVPANLAALAAYIPVDDVDRDRLAITRHIVEHAMLTYPQLDRFPEVEDAAWGAIHLAITGRCDARASVASMQTAATAVLGGRDR